MARLCERLVGYDRFVGEHAYRQLTELYRALRLYVNCFQPSMKLLSKHRDGKKVRYIYDPAKTPLQRLLQELEQLQKALFRCAVEGNPFVSHASSRPLRVFAVEQRRTDLGPVEGSVPDASAGLATLYQEQEKRKRVLGWRRTHKDPFVGEWERIISWLQANPERSSGDIFRELQRLSP